MTEFMHVVHIDPVFLEVELNNRSLAIDGSGKKIDKIEYSTSAVFNPITGSVDRLFGAIISFS